jgi:O-antigen/teichoic acid export membrane protein
MLFPHVAAQPDARATATTERTSRLTLLATVGAAAALAAVSPLLLGWVFGPAYRAGVPALLVLLAAMPPLALARVLAADLKGRGRPGLVSVGSGVGVALTVVGDVALIPVLGIEGAALASVVAYTGMAAVLVGCYRRVTGGSLLALLPRFSDLGDVVRLGRARRSDVSAAEGRMSGPAPVAGTNPTRPTEGDAVPADDDVRSLR